SLERTLSARELFFDKVLTNKFVWLLAVANFFAYITRYSMLDWGPTYLREVKGATLQQGGLAVLVNEFGGIPSTIFLGWVSDVIGGRRGMVAALCMIPIFASFLVIMFTPPGYLWLDMTMLALIGLFVYPVINLIVIAALDVVSKKAIGTAAGFIGLFGYIGRTVQAKGFGWTADHYTTLYGQEAAWNIVLSAILASAAIAGVLLALTWHARPKA
ncbi:MAG: MFS transporter, partial [Planctomycetales bacterium]|nr:MFS transporter [Planctomycetales bacterium]NIP70221.1 MFS transporter [Planctomycetales bacterium]